MLRRGASPEKLAWSLAAGVLIGINPLLGSTTVLSLALAFSLRLNVAASQLATHLFYPLELLLLIPFIRLGSRIFRTAGMPLSPSSLLHAARTNPLALTRQLWLWEWHAFLLWLVVAAIATPLLAVVLTPLLSHLVETVERHEPNVPA